MILQSNSFYNNNVNIVGKYYPCNCLDMFSILSDVHTIMGKLNCLLHVDRQGQ